MSYFKFRSEQAIDTACSNVLMNLHKLNKIGLKNYNKNSINTWLNYIDKSS